MRIAIEHQIVHQPRVRGSGVVQMLRLTPDNSDEQTVAHWRIDVDCDARMRAGRDGFGNAVTMLYIEEPVEMVTITATGDILTSDAHGIVRGTQETLPPALYLRGTSATPATSAITAFSAEAVRDCHGPLAILHSLNAAIHRRFAIDHDSAVDAAALLGEAKSGPCDLAHFFCTGARSLGLPARFVSGFVAQEGAARPHCWAEAYVEGIGWLGFDPAIGLSPTDTHVRVAVALDAAGAVPIAGEAWSDIVSLTDATQ
ncbi:transglutaminase family protein [Sphingomonas paucimobilis]|uniref:transglutaminase family protein n=1 Tax=Sphingomonas paucimobilis TaxID=13689 RepID=UPI0028D6D63B|nr:transglutaminase family protein [Sphingomonas paucimobilis]